MNIHGPTPTMWTTTPAELADWYEEHLGAEVIQEDDSRVIRFSGDDGHENYVTIGQRTDGEAGAAASDLTLTFQIDDVSSVISKLRRNDVVVDLVDGVPPSVGCFYTVTDPDGRSLNLVQFTESAMASSEDADEAGGTESAST